LFKGLQNPNQVIGTKEPYSQRKQTIGFDMLQAKSYGFFKILDHIVFFGLD
jgi:hypothetical protein